MNHPLLYEINTRCWLRSLSEQSGKPITLANVPEAEFTRWQELGLTHIWAMGVWTNGPRCRNLCFDGGSMEATLSRLLPGWQKDDVPGSPYAIADYHVPAALGGEAGLKAFRKKLHARGLKLLLDFRSQLTWASIIHGRPNPTSTSSTVPRRSPELSSTRPPPVPAGSPMAKTPISPPGPILSK